MHDSTTRHIIRNIFPNWDSCPSEPDPSIGQNCFLRKGPELDDMLKMFRFDQNEMERNACSLTIS